MYKYFRPTFEYTIRETKVTILLIDKKVLSTKLLVKFYNSKRAVWEKNVNENGALRLDIYLDNTLK